MSGQEYFHLGIKILQSFNILKVLAFVRIESVYIWNLVLFQLRNDLFSLIHWDDPVFATLKDCHRILDPVRKEDWRPLTIEVLGCRIRTN